MGNSYLILSGLNEGEDLMKEGTLNVDATSQLEGKPSKMNHDEPKTDPKPKKVNSMPVIEI